jgi:hypothetical protein
MEPIYVVLQRGNLLARIPHLSRLAVLDIRVVIVFVVRISVGVALVVPIGCDLEEQGQE